jgi:predicted permease
MYNILQDLRYGIRMLLKRPGFTLIAVLTLSLGIGANTAVFSIINAILLRPLPYQEPDRLAYIKEELPSMGPELMGGVSHPEFLDYKNGNQSFSGLAGFISIGVNMTGLAVAERLQAMRVSADLFPVLGVKPMLGRAFSPVEDEVGKDDVVILSHGLWLRQFRADAGVLGKTLKLNERPYTVIGVTSPEFRFPIAGGPFSTEVELWVPLALTPKEIADRAASFDVGVIGRLKPGVSQAQADADIAGVAARLQQQYPQIYTNKLQMRATVVGVNEQTTQAVRPLLWVLLAAVGLVLLIACANVANLLLARAASRCKEIALRAALGASRARVVRQLLTESLLLALAGGGGGLLLAVWIVGLIVRFGPTDVPRLSEASVDPSVLGFTLLVSLLTAVLFGLLPALQSSKLNLTEALKEAGSRSGRGAESRRRLDLLAALEMAAALTLLIGAGLLVGSFLRVLRTPPGFNPEGLLTAYTSLPAERYKDVDQGKAVHRRVLERLAALPGVKSVAAATNLPMVWDWTIGMLREGDDNYYNASNTWVSDEYFQTVGVRLKSGRTFNSADRMDTPPVIVINETMARRHWPGENPIGKRIQWGGWASGWLTVVGVVEDVKLSSLEAKEKPAVYMPMFQIPRLRPTVVYFARTDGDPSALASAVRREIQAVDAELPVYDIRTMNQVISTSLAKRRFSMTLLAGFAAVALALAAIGLYGVMSYRVEQSTQEIGVRMALGAETRDVLQLTLKQGLRPAIAGLAIGLASSLALTRWMSGLLFGVSATDPLIYAGVSSLLLCTALAAVYVPARRATKVDPMVALRAE